MLLVAGYIDNEPESGHMYLVIRHKGKFFVLDNIEQDVKPIDEAVYMEVQFTFSEFSVQRIGNHPDWDVERILARRWINVLRRVERGL